MRIRRFVRRAIASRVINAWPILMRSQMKCESLSQLLRLAQDRSQQLLADLAMKAEEFAVYRRKQDAEITQLRTAHDLLVQTHAATEQSLTILRECHAKHDHELTQALMSIQALKCRLADQEATYSSETARMKHLIELLEAREAQAKTVVEMVEAECARAGEQFERSEVALEEELMTQRLRAEEAECRVERLQGLLEQCDLGKYHALAGVSSCHDLATYDVDVLS